MSDRSTAVFGENKLSLTYNDLLGSHVRKPKRARDYVAHRDVAGYSTDLRTCYGKNVRGEIRDLFPGREMKELPTAEFSFQKSPRRILREAIRQEPELSRQSTPSSRICWSSSMTKPPNEQEDRHVLRKNSCPRRPCGAADPGVRVPDEADVSEEIHDGCRDLHVQRTFDVLHPQAGRLCGTYDCGCRHAQRSYSNIFQCSRKHFRVNCVITYNCTKDGYRETEQDRPQSSPDEARKLQGSDEIATGMRFAAAAAAAAATALILTITITNATKPILFLCRCNQVGRARVHEGDEKCGILSDRHGWVQSCLLCSSRQQPNSARVDQGEQRTAEPDTDGRHSEPEDPRHAGRLDRRLDDRWRWSLCSRGRGRRRHSDYSILRRRTGSAGDVSSIPKR